MTRTEAKGAVRVTIHHEVVVGGATPRVSFVIPHVLCSLHPQEVVVFFFDMLSRKDFVKRKIEVYKLLKSVTVA